MRILAILGSAAMGLFLWGAAAQAQSFQPIGPEQARLIVSPTAFGNIGVSRSVYDTGAARYERWTTRIDPTRRFYQFLLREAGANMIVLDTADLQQTAHQMLGDAGRGIVLEPPFQLATHLGPASVARFSFSGFGCAVFHIPFGTVMRDAPANLLKGLFCDPATPRLPDYDVGNTLNAIGVYGYFEPAAPPVPPVFVEPLGPSQPGFAPGYDPSQPFPGYGPSVPPVKVPVDPPLPYRQVIPSPFPN